METDRREKEFLGGGVGRPLKPEAFAELYRSTPPWDIGRPQPPFLELGRRGALEGNVLDVGCGTGEHALMAAELGLKATGVDTAEEALAMARRKAQERGLAVRFLNWNALSLGGLGEKFNTVLDCGLFHVFDDQDRIAFVDSLGAVVPEGGRYYMLCFSERQAGDFGPRRVTQAEIRSSFREGWGVDSIEPAELAINTNPGIILAWLACIVRT